ncbi:mucin-4-like [Hypanus sabinus]|uniref:mucin-4-like n=1 Tax=Hypanus sabinus TaxID=79690 RepID=UPI0028C3C56E|nr:mucin-4-like [Hypanus sabinus]
MTTASKLTSIDTTTSKPTSSGTTTSKLTSSTTTTSKPTSTTKTTSKPTTTTTTSTTTMSTTARPIQSDGHVILFPYGDQVSDKRLKDSLSAERAAKTNLISPTFKPKMFFTFGETMLSSVYSNTFQAVITTDGTYSFVLMLYEFGGMNWNVSKLPSKNVVIGYNSGSGFFKNDEQMNLPDSEKFRPDQRKGANAGTSNKILRRVNRNTHNASQRCIYRKDGAFIEGWQERYWIPTIQSPLLSKNKGYDLDPYTWCCEEVDDPKFCDYYKVKRPSITCEEYRPPGQGLGNGDPHFFTLDGLPFTFNGLGDFVLLNITESNDTTSFQLHARTVQTGEAQATNFAAFAAWHKTITVQMTLKGNDTIDVQLNEDNVQFTPTEGNKEVFYVDNFYLEKKGNSSVLAVFENGISLNVTAEFEMLSIVPSLPKIFMNKTQGLLGLWNDNQNDDFTMPNGSIIPANSSESTLYRYGLTWEVPSDQSIFTIQSVIARTANNMFTPVFLDELRQQNITLYNKGVAACNTNTQCIYDVVSTGKIEIGLSTAKTFTQFNEDMKTLNSFPPTIEGNSVISTNLSEQVISRYTVKQHGSVVFNPYISKDLNITANGTLIWLPTNRNGLTVDVEAIDSNNLTSVLRPQLVLCDCGENGECNFNDSTRINRSSVYIAACICKDGFNDLSCRSSVDICQTLTCFTGVNCSSTGCGSCPAGLNGDGIQCLDIDECKGNNSCSPNATCINTVRSYNCICKEGFSGNGIYCSDITECSTCSPNAVCKETEGKFKCICNERFTGNGTTCTPLPGPCDSSQCSPTFCRNGGTCSLNPSLNCTPVCQCPSPYTGEQCTLVSLVFLAAQSPDLPKRVVNITLTLTNVNETSEINSTLAESIKEKVLEKANKVQQFNNIAELRYWKRGGNVVASSQYFFNYNGNRTIIDFLNENLHSAILTAFNNAERAATSVSEFAPLNTSDIQDVSRLTYNQLLKFFNCNSTIFSGYVLQWDEQHGVVCRSPCDMDYCFNQAECQHQPTGPTCKCIPRTIYDSFGDRCEHLAMNLRAFFGILFGALAFLLLLMLAIFLIVWKCKSSGRSRFSNDSDSITPGNRQIFSWQSNPFSSKIKDTAILPSLDEKNLSPITWKPHLDNVNPAAEIKIERPSLKRIGSDSEIP